MIVVRASNIDITQETQLLAGAERFKFKTLSKKRKFNTVVGKGDDSQEALMSVEVISSHEVSLPEEGDRELDAHITGGTMAKGWLAKIVSRVESSMIGLGKALEKIARLTHGQFVENEENFHMVSGAVQNLISVLGPAVNMDERFEALKLWGTTSFIGEEVGCNWQFRDCSAFGNCRSVD